jgi:general secretion pathway protein G
MENGPGRADAGFTLVEMLVVIVILGVLATVALFAVAGVADRGQSSACASEHQTLAGAEAAYSAEQPTFGTMAELVSAGRLRNTSTLFTITVNAAGDDYTLTGIAGCAGYVHP